MFARVLWQVLSLFVSLLIISFIFLFYVGILPLYYIPPILGTLGVVVGFRYSALYHQFSRPMIQRALTVLLGGLSLTLVSVSLYIISNHFVVDELRMVFEFTMLQPASDEFLPDWWYAIILIISLIFIILGAISSTETKPYPKPSGYSSLATSPPYFGFVCTFFGLWAVLFVGIGIQRVIVIAPVFEELLKFGAALLIGSVLFGRSIAGRLGVAIVVGSLFGVIEHATTYPAEADAAYLFRSIFHMITAAVSVAIYTVFERNEERGLMWVSPIFPMIIHFSYNTFVVFSSLIMVIIVQSQPETVILLYGTLAIIICLGLLLLTLINNNIIYALHRPIHEVLSELT